MSTFLEIYQTLKEKDRNTPSHAKSFINAIANETGYNPHTVQQWVLGNLKPRLGTQRIIAACLQKPVEELFPND